jgi:predicted membrane protein
MSAGPSPPPGPEPAVPGPEPPPSPGPEQAPPTDRHAPAAATVLVGALLVLVGIGWLLDAAGIGVPWRAILPASLIAVGLACVAGAFRGRQHALMVVGVVLTVVLSLAVTVDWDLDMPVTGGVGDRTEQPRVPGDLTDYELAVGNLEVDLRQLQVPPGTTAVDARVGVGELVVHVPSGVSVDVSARSGLGEVQVLGQQQSGFGSRIDTTVDAGRERTLRLDVRVGLGQVQVDR